LSGAEFCGLAFGFGAHLSATTSDGSLVPFLLRPHPNSSEDPDSVLTPMALLMLKPDAQATTGGSKPVHSKLGSSWSQVVSKGLESPPMATLCSN
jgi:hypothetical protein